MDIAGVLRPLASLPSKPANTEGPRLIASRMVNREVAEPAALAPHTIAFRIQGQGGDNLCWAAVASSISHQQGDGQFFSQCELATLMLPNKSCCTGIDDCDVAQSTAEALRKASRLEEPPLDQPIEFERIKTEIDNEKPRLIGCGLGIAEDAHAVIIYGWFILNGSPHVFVQNPRGQAVKLFDFGKFSAGKIADYDWKRTYLTR